MSEHEEGDFGIVDGELVQVQEIVPNEQGGEDVAVVDVDPDAADVPDSIRDEYYEKFGDGNAN